ncbi:spore cortex biosynthesis protein YabQ [Salipaludibacillus neizhouensis]|uniref:Spore cortex biosynthesis protein YabQ n=1 Tax=Salipaludibacillus neizhouensis TaxID=885475 RepID=A0A3A9K1T8_9BACI|nr:spore cortex biosynthesis protein YabQ [Salipaludibacillus neizhouensis]RKL65218.1 spore cortex biosynthesis protein YabQ [Salipaludibacillus neizhouensis]
MSLDIQMLSMLASVIMGIFLGASLDTYIRIIRFNSALSWVRVISDILFWILHALLFFIVLLNVNNGEVRFYLLLSLLLGYAIYRALFESSYKKILDVLLGVIKSVASTLARIVYLLILNPVKVLLKQLGYSVMILITGVWIILTFILKWTLWPVFFTLKWVDKLSGYPFLAQRKKLTEILKTILNRLRGFYKNK